MKTRGIVFSFIVAFLLYACDKVDCPYDDGCDPQPTVCLVNGVDTCMFSGTNDTVISNDIGNSFRKVFIEEFTGYQCNNCPEGAAEIKLLLKKYKDTLIAVSVHAGFYAKPSPSKGFVTDFRTDAGEEFNTTFQVLAYPAAVINRTQFSGKYPQSKSNWGSIIKGQTKLPNVLDLKLTSVYNAKNNAVYAVANIEFLQDYSSATNILFEIMENKVIDQQDSSGIIFTDYEHKHVLRGTLGTFTGEIATSSSVTTGATSSIISNYLMLDPSWNATNCRLVAIVYNADTKEVLQVEKIHLKN